MSLLAEGLLAMRGCWRLIRRDPEAFEDFNLTIQGFWRSFAMVVPVLILAYPLFLSDHAFGLEFAAQGGEPARELQLGRAYFYLLSGIAIWPFIAALLARLLGVGRNYVPYMIIYNWITVPMMALAIIPHLLNLATGAAVLAGALVLAVQFFSLYVSWYVAKAGLRTTAPIAVAFTLGEFALTLALSAVLR